MNSFNPGSISIPSGHFISGSFRSGRAVEIEVSRPSDGIIYSAAPCADRDIVDFAVSDALRAFRQSEWAKQEPGARAQVLFQLSLKIEEHAVELARLESLGSTRPISQCLSWDLPYLAGLFRYYAGMADKFGGDAAPTDEGRVGLMLREPIGVIGAIAPWNFPLVMAATKIAPALAAGNTVVLKPSEFTPFSVLRLAELSILAGMPKGVFNVVLGGGEVTGAALVEHPDISKISFTGSTATGEKIMSAAAYHGLKPVTLELGGKSPQIVFEDANIRRTASIIAQSVLGNAGQVCVAGSRIIAHEAIVDQLQSELAIEVLSARPGPTWQEDTTFSPIISERQMQRIERIVNHSVAEGAEVVFGGARMDREGHFYEPTLLINVQQRYSVVQKEIFGPVLTMQKFSSEEEAISFANGSTFGLAAGVHTNDLSRALRVMRQLDVGTVWINRYGRSNDYSMCTGGFKRSGIGKDLGREAFLSSQRIKSVLIDVV